jgi:4-amino-4-deoxy-L-arabinose transferase-like glycosyltransferase
MRLRSSHRLALVLFVAVLVRLPFWIEAWRTPLDGDTAIIGLMARHPLRSTSMWGQPYGSPLDAWAAIPFVAALGSKASALRILYFLLGLGLVPVAYVVAGALDRRAALPAAFLMAVPAPYFLLLASLPPPLYPTTLLLCAGLLALTLRIDARLVAGGTPVAAMAVLGALAGLALWTHLMSASVVVAAGLFLAVRAGPRRRVLGAAVVPLLLVSAPWWTGIFKDGWALHVIAVSSPDQAVGEHVWQILPVLHRPILGLLGVHVPIVADDPQSTVAAPLWAAVGLVVLYAVGLVIAARASRGRGAVALLLGVIVLAVLAFPFPVRSGGHTVRYLTAAYLPLVVLLAWAPLAGRENAGAGRRAWAFVLALSCLHLVSGARLLAAWRSLDRAAEPFLLANLDPVVQILESRGIQRAYAPYDVAYRLTFESGERLVVSEPWNERFRHYPLPYLDEVRFAKNVGWIFVPETSGDLPTARSFEDALNAIGGRWRRTRAGAASLYDAFEPPFGPTVEPLASAGLAGDGDLATHMDPRPSQPTTFVFPSARRLDAVTVLAGLGGAPLARSLDVEVSADGSTFETVASRRRREERHDLRWVGGHPQYVLDHDLLAVPLGGRLVAAIRLSPYASTEPWSIGEVLLHPAEDRAERRPWDEWLDPGLGWSARREALAVNPRRDREDWYYRVLLAQRAR